MTHSRYFARAVCKMQVVAERGGMKTTARSIAALKMQYALQDPIPFVKAERWAKIVYRTKPLRTAKRA